VYRSINLNIIYINFFPERIPLGIAFKYARPAEVAGSGHLTALKPSVGQPAKNSFDV